MKLLLLGFLGVFGNPRIRRDTIDCPARCWDLAGTDPDECSPDPTKVNLI